MDIFHRHREAQEQELANAMLELALQTPEYRPEALIWKGIDALPNDPKLAFIYLSNAAHALPDRADVHALLGRSILAQGQPELATRYLSAVWQKLPNDPSLRMILWQARSQSASPAELRRMILAHLPHITAPSELNFVLKILAAQTDAPSTVGVVRYLPEEKEIQGWAVDLRNVHAPAALVLEANANTLSVVANVAHPLLTAAGLPATHGGIRIKVPNPTLAVTVRFATGLPLLGSPVSAMPTFVPPPPLPDVGKHQPVDVLIPVYDGLEETLECINSAIAARKLNRTPHRLVVVDDATPVPALGKALKVLASKGKITLIQQPANLGFIRTMNRAMALSPRQDVVWLNADTRVHGNWLDRLRDTAYSADDIASVTPFTNNGELMSFPISRCDSPMPTAEESAYIDSLAAKSKNIGIELETGCGFCMYVKRMALNTVGYLDEKHLSRGYGEETDWCLRARENGWRHMGDTSTFVAHKGGISFREEKLLRVAYNNAILRSRYPKAERSYAAYCERDPLLPARNRLQRCRLIDFCKKTKLNNAAEMLTIHLQPSGEPLLPLCLTWHQNHTGAIVTLHMPLEPLKLEICYTLPAQMEFFETDLSYLRDHGVINDLTSSRWNECPDFLLATIKSLRIPRSIIEDNLEPAQISGGLLAPTDTMLKPSGRTLIIDKLNNSTRIDRWAKLARATRQSGSSSSLLTYVSAEEINTLRATGGANNLPVLPGLNLEDTLMLAGVQAGVSSSGTQDIDWPLYKAAYKNCLTLYLDHGTSQGQSQSASATIDINSIERSLHWRPTQP
ncbi:glycosyl transferase [Pseudomonas sp. Leaf129]|uniref:glycosyltransferase n=1 Tax=Pseudomonas sp. Leaf129 TaxID=1736268 RepID=UPI00070343B4|nr:glycosyltransferase [Pseudomonas sp. Leaf129]KQQ63582.1 glycosyl transferase [Pseudomonas sp. Leaf129]